MTTLPDAAHVSRSSASTLRRDQFTAVASRTAVTASCSLGSFLVVMGTFWSGSSHLVLCGLLLTLVALHGAAVLRSRAWLDGPRDDLSDRQFALRILVTVLVGLTWSVALFALMPGANMDQKQLLIYVFSGLTTGSLLVAPILPAAIAMAGIPTVAIIAVMPFLHQTISLDHGIVALLFLAMTLGVAYNLNADFRRRCENEAKVRDQNDTISLLLNDYEQGASDWLWTVDADCRLQGPTGRFCAVFGCAEDRLDGVDLRTLLDCDMPQHADDVARFLAAIDGRAAFRDLRLPFVVDRRCFWLCLSGRPLMEGEHCVGYRGVAANVTDAQRSSDQIAFLARYDSLTGLPNRILFNETLRSAVTGGDPLALLCLDLDGFKPVNDTYGHSIGDALLTMVAARVRGCLREGDLAARLGGDEFAILLRCVDAAAPRLLAERLIEAVGAPFSVGDIRLFVTLSVGLVASGDGRSPEQLLQAGDIALYASKSRGRGRWSVFEQSMADAAQERHLLQADLRDAIENDGLSLAFQPIVDARARTVSCVEALVRWQHPRLGSVPPDRFIPLAEDNGLIVTLGSWVLRQACREAASWPSDVRVAVNLSPLQLRDAALLSGIDAALAMAGLPPERLEIEITESVFLGDSRATLDCLRALRERGIRISLDDFGTGYSSLSYLRSFPFDKVKIDRSFVRDLGESTQALSIVRAVVGMASSLGISTTGEGVETDQQADMLDVVGCDEFQGYLFGRPCSTARIGSIIAEQHRAWAAPCLS